MHAIRAVIQERLLGGGICRGWRGWVLLGWGGWVLLPGPRVASSAGVSSLIITSAVRATVLVVHGWGRCGERGMGESREKREPRGGEDTIAHAIKGRVGVHRAGRREPH